MVPEPETRLERRVLRLELRAERIPLGFQRPARQVHETREPREAARPLAEERPPADILQLHLLQLAQGLDRLRQHGEQRARRLVAEHRVDPRLVAHDVLDVDARDDRLVPVAHHLDEDAAPLVGGELLAQ